MRKQAFLGFTLIELLITVAIIAILAALATPSYLDYIRKGRRSDAISALTAAQLAQEKWRANQTTYGTLAQLGLPSTSPENYYSISVAQTVTNTADCTVTGNPTANAYAIVATGQNGQDQDAGCTALCLDQTGTFYPTVCIRR